MPPPFTCHNKYLSLEQTPSNISINPSHSRPTFLASSPPFVPYSSNLAHSHSSFHPSPKAPPFIPHKRKTQHPKSSIDTSSALAPSHPNTSLHPQPLHSDLSSHDHTPILSQLNKRIAHLHSNPPPSTKPRLPRSHVSQPASAHTTSQNYTISQNTIPYNHTKSYSSPDRKTQTPTHKRALPIDSPAYPFVNRTRDCTPAKPNETQAPPPLP